MSVPHVTALITAYDCERFIGEAVDSALAQDYEGRLDVVVIDDGSTDGTARELASRDVRVIRQENRGYVAATHRAIAEGEGELFALLDADDVWPADKIRRQVAALGDAALLYGDMTVIDAEGNEIDPSWLGDASPPKDLAGWLCGNVATSSSILMRADMARRWCPIPRGLAFADWYFAIRAMRESRVVYLPEPRTSYRFHGENMSLGSSGERHALQLREALKFQRWWLRRADPEPGLWAAWEAFEAFATKLQSVAETPFTQLVRVTAEDRDLAEALGRQARQALDAGNAHEALAAGIRAAAADPWCREARETARQAALAVAG
ncbi:glycosyltransferase [Candidatus Solirubrobacter pratensis]|uniref:glycosyltransferase n=1 Tax=Candidatus Solirubrobacter pratensis TaxID=1298857 RepID=UPI00042A53C9|nr:glycosyltransferase [Candidatus Solirubrobacter pratensis]